VISKELIIKLFGDSSFYLVSLRMTDIYVDKW